MKDGTCQEYFPKPFVSDTCIVEGNYYGTCKQLSPAVGGEQVDRIVRMGSLIRTHQGDNSWVVPYNSNLTRMVACHSNVDLSVMYITSSKY